MTAADEVDGTGSAPTYLVVATAALLALAVTLVATALRVRARAHRRRELEARKELTSEQRAWLERF